MELREHRPGVTTRGSQAVKVSRRQAKINRETAARENRLYESNTSGGRPTACKDYFSDTFRFVRLPMDAGQP